jgi:hypothetical protein
MLGLSHGDRPNPAVVLTALAVAVAATACMGEDESGRKRAEAAEWCRMTIYLDDAADARDGGYASVQITYDRADEWIESAPAEIRDATRRAAKIVRELQTDPPDPGLAPAREAIGDYAADYCSEPLDCFGDVGRYPVLPCLADEAVRQ